MLCTSPQKQKCDTRLMKRKTKLFFINLGGYKENEFEEYHYKMMLLLQRDKVEAIRKSKRTAIL